MKLVLAIIVAMIPALSNAGESPPRACGTGYQYRTPQNDLEDAIKSHDISKVQAAVQIPGVKINYDINSADFNFDCAPPIFQSISEGQVDIMNLLVQQGASVNAIMGLSASSPTVERTPLMWAAYTGQIALVEALLKYPQIGINDKAHPGGETALFLAVEERNYDSATVIAQDPRVDVTIVIRRNFSAPQTAILGLIGNSYCEKGYVFPCHHQQVDLNLLSILAQKSGVAINSDDGQSRPIDAAIRANDDGIIDAIMKSTTPIELFTPIRGGTALEEALWYNNAHAVSTFISQPQLPIDLVEKYVTNDPQVASLHDGAISPAFAALFESSTLNPNAIDANGKSLLERYANLPTYILPLLKNPKVDVNIHNGGPLWWAQFYYNSPLCKGNAWTDQCKSIDAYITELKSLGAH